MSNTRNILASFRTIDNAQAAAQEIVNLGIKDVQVDQIGKYPGTHLNPLMNPITGDFDSLSDLTLGSLDDKGAEVLAAVDVSASGMSDGSNVEINDNVLVTIVTDEEKAKQVEQIIEKFRGKI